MHGLLAGESEAILKAKPEPAVVLNPPRDGASPAELEQDDGLLTASEGGAAGTGCRLGGALRLQHGGG